MSEVFFKVRRISENTDPNKGWELQFKLIDQCLLTEGKIYNSDFIFQVGDEKWIVSSSKSDKQNQFNNAGDLWYVKGSLLDPSKKKKYKNISRDTMHYSYDFINGLTNVFPLIKEKEFRGYYSKNDNTMFVVREV